MSEQLLPRPLPLATNTDRSSLRRQHTRGMQPRDLSMLYLLSVVKAG
jgi:hypothetical protein